MGLRDALSPCNIRTPYPGTGLHARVARQRRMTTRDWDLYDMRHVVYQPARMSPEALKRGYDGAYCEFYRWPSIARASWAHGSPKHQAKHFFHAASVAFIGPSRWLAQPRGCRAW